MFDGGEVWGIWHTASDSSKLCLLNFLSYNVSPVKPSYNQFFKVLLVKICTCSIHQSFSSHQTFVPYSYVTFSTNFESLDNRHHA